MRADQLADFDALILLSIASPETAFIPTAGSPSVARFGVGYDTVDVEACTRAGIALVITPDGVRRPVAVSIITLMLALTGKLMVKDALTREGPPGFARRGEHMGVGLVGRTLGSVGIGNIGAEMFRLARAVRHALPRLRSLCRRQASQPNSASSSSSLDDVFRRSDVISINCPLTPQTRHLVNAERIALMKRGAYLINTARGPIVDQQALTAALQERRIAGAGLDVLEQEPPDADDPILKLDNVILAPHALCWTDQCFAGNGAADVKAVLGRPTRTHAISCGQPRRPRYRALAPPHG